jgi:hypothetical protein
VSSYYYISAYIGEIAPYHLSTVKWTDGSLEQVVKLGRALVRALVDL